MGNLNDHPTIGPIPGPLFNLIRSPDIICALILDTAKTDTHILTDRRGAFAQPNIKQLGIGPLCGRDSPLLPRYQLRCFGCANGTGWDSDIPCNALSTDGPFETIDNKAMTQ